LSSARKKFAHFNKEEALVALAARNKRYIAILREKLRWAIKTRDAVQKEMGNEKTADPTDGGNGLLHLRGELRVD
jgi:hypothetical protein